MKSAFVTPWGQYIYKRMPFGLCNAPASFQKAVRKIIEGLKGVTNYLDDILIYSTTFEDHMKTLQQLLKKLREYHLFLKPKKCTIATHETEFLGYIINENGVRTNPEKVKEVAAFPRPKNTSEVRAFLGLLQHYRKFIRNCSKIAAPLHYLLRKDAPFYWTRQQEQAFQTLKYRLCTAPVIA